MKRSQNLLYGHTILLNYIIRFLKNCYTSSKKNVNVLLLIKSFNYVKLGELEFKTCCYSAYPVRDLIFVIMFFGLHFYSVGIKYLFAFLYIIPTG